MPQIGQASNPSYTPCSLHSNWTASVSFPNRLTPRLLRPITVVPLRDTVELERCTLGLIQFGGHLPKGEYDVDHDGDAGQADAALVYDSELTDSGPNPEATLPMIDVS